MVEQRRTAAASSRRSGMLAFVLSLVARIALYIVGGGLVWSLVPALFGWHPTVVMSGSMQPRIGVGDIVVSRPIPRDKLIPGEILLVNSPDFPGQLRLHRFERFDNKGDLVLRGDANKRDDSTPVALNAVRGMASLRIPFIGTPVVWAKNHDYGSLLATAAILAALIRLATWWRAPWTPEETPARRRARRVPPSLRRALTGLRPSRATLTKVGCITAVLIVIGFGLESGTRAQAKLLGTTGNPTNNWSAAASFGTCQSVATADGAYEINPLNDSSGTTATDLSGNNYTGLYRGTAGSQYKLAQAGPCPQDGAKSVTVVGSGTTSGSGGWVATSHQLAGGPTVFTIEIWFKTAAGYSNGGGLIGYGNSANTTAMPAGWDRQVYMSNNGTLNFGVSNGTDQYASTTATYNDGNWHLMDAELSSAGQKLYVDGVLKASIANNTDDWTSSAGYWRIGVVHADGPSAPSSYYFNGSLAFAAMYSTALTATQISNHYATGH